MNWEVNMYKLKTENKNTRKNEKNTCVEIMSYVIFVLNN